MNRLSVAVSSSDHMQGAPTAPVTLVEYGDFECRHCGEAFSVIKAVQSLMGEQLCFVFRNFPIYEIHPHAIEAAEFAEAAASIGKFWQAHDVLYQHQGSLTDIDLLTYGERFGLDVSSLNSAFGGEFDNKIREDFVGGLRSGVSGTPAFFINGARYFGQPDVNELAQALSVAAVHPQFQAVFS